MKRVVVLLLCCAAFAAGAQAQAPCCSVTAINAATGIVSAKVNANGETFQFKLTNANLLKELRVGEGVYANFTTHQVSLDGKTIAGPITSGPQAPAPVTAPKIAPPPAITFAPVTAPKIASSSSAPTATGSASSGSTAPTGATPALNPVCAGSSTLEGVDVASFSGTVNWKQVQASGRTFAYAKATTGTNYTDPTFATNYAAIKAAGLHRGAYHTFDPTADGTTQAQYFLSLIGTLQPGDLPPALDVEPGSAVGAVSVSVLQAGILQWMTKVQAATGRTPILYSSPAILQQALGSGSSSDLLWVASWGVTCPALPAGSHQWVFWQSSGSGKVPGINGAVDLDEFNGSLADLKALTNP